MEAVVEYDYDAEQDDELTLKAGDIIKNVITAEGGWWEGELGGKKGMFPDNFVRLKTKPAEKEGKKEATQRKSVRELASKFKDGVPLPGQQDSVAHKRKSTVKMKKCKVMFDYKAENEDELDLTTGQLVDFIKEVEEGWWEGSMDGKVGVFPSNFVEMVEDGGDGAAPPAEGGKPAIGEGDEAAFHEIKGKKVMGVGLGNIFQGGPIQLRSTGKNKPKSDDKDNRDSKPPVTNPPDVFKREKQASTKSVERAVVRYSYVAEQPDELSLKEGEMVRVMDKFLEDEGWWRGEVNGKVGVFPDNFVELLPDEPARVPKKPPPPVAKNMYPKLPEKSMSVEEKPPPLSKKEPEPLSAGSVKKPMIPPPVGKKKPAMTPPVKPEPPKVMEPPTAKVEMRHKDPPSNHQASPAQADTNNHAEEGADQSLDAVESSSLKLVHLTANRNKGPPKRPPSTVVLAADLDKMGSDSDDSRANHHVQPQKPPPPVTKDIKHLPPSDMDRSHRQDSTEAAAPHSSSHVPPRPPEPVRHHDPVPAVSTAATAALGKQVEELQRELRELRTSTVSRVDYEDLRGDLQFLRQEFDSFKASQSKKLVDLMMEVDEEKKLRLTTQVEMERVKKMVAESHV